VQKCKLFSLSAGGHKKQKRIPLLMLAVLHLFTNSLFKDCNKSELHNVECLTNNIFEGIGCDLIWNTVGKNEKYCQINRSARSPIFDSREYCE
jgi:hypothetical protein